MKTITLPDGYAKKRTLINFRVIELAEVRAWASPVEEACTFCNNGYIHLGSAECPPMQTLSCGACHGTLVRLMDRTPSHVWFLSNDGTARRAKINGKVRTWKRDANRIELPLKYGLYEYATFTAADIEAGKLLEEI